MKKILSKLAKIVIGFIVIIILLFVVFKNTNIKKTYTNVNVDSLFKESQVQYGKLIDIAELALVTDTITYPYLAQYKSNEDYDITLFGKAITVYSKEIDNILNIVYKYQIKLGYTNISITKKSNNTIEIINSRPVILSIEHIKDSIIEERGIWNKTTMSKIEFKIKEVVLKQANSNNDLFARTKQNYYLYITNLIDSLGIKNNHIEFK